MSQDFSNKYFQGNVYFPSFEEGLVLAVGQEGIVNPVPLPTLKSLIFYQTTPSSNWEFNHDFGVLPFVTVYDDVGNNITYGVNIVVDENIVRIHTDNSPITGKVEVYSLGAAPGVTSENGALITKDFTLNTEIAVNTNYLTTIEVAKIYQLFKLNCPTPVRLRIYLSQSQQTLDLNRGVGAYPAINNGLIFECVTSLSNPVIDLSPVVTSYNLEDTSNSYITITNLSATSLSSLNFSLTYLPLRQ